MHHGGGPITWIFTALLVGMITLLAAEEKIKAKKSMITGLFAALSLLLGAVFGILPFGKVVLPGASEVDLPVFIPGIDWGVITIILGASLFVDAISRSGIFSYMAIKLTRLSGGDPLRLLASYSMLTVVFSAVLNNVTAMIIVGSLTAVSLSRLHRKDLLLGFLLTEGLLTNVGGLLTLISSVPNIILGNLAGISFVRFFLVAAPYAAVASVATIGMAVAIFKIRPIRDPDAKRAAKEQVMAFDATDGIESRRFFFVSWFLLAGFITAIATTTLIPYVSDLGMGFVAMLFALAALWRYKHEVDRNYAAMDWDLLFFFIYLFVVINVAEHAGVLDMMGRSIAAVLGFGRYAGGALLMLGSAIASSVTDNVPLSAVVGKILKAQGIPATSPFWWASIFGTNLGGNFTPIGSASTVVAVSIMHKYDLKVSFVGFIKKAAPFAVMHLVLAAIYVALVTGR